MIRNRASNKYNRRQITIHLYATHGANWTYNPNRKSKVKLNEKQITTQYYKRNMTMAEYERNMSFRAICKIFPVN